MIDAHGLLLVLQILGASVTLTVGVLALWPKSAELRRDINIYARMRALELRVDEVESIRDA